MRSTLGNLRIRSSVETYLKMWIHIYDKISNNSKSVLGPNLNTDSVNLLSGLRYIFIEEDSRKKSRLLNNYINMTYEIESFIKILSANKDISIKQEANLVELLLDIREQATNWVTSVESHSVTDTSSQFKD